MKGFKYPSNKKKKKTIKKYFRKQKKLMPRQPIKIRCDKIIFYYLKNGTNVRTKWQMLDKLKNATIKIGKGEENKKENQLHMKNFVV